MRVRIWEKESNIVERGGSWCFEWLCRAAYRFNYGINHAIGVSDLGLRLVRRAR